MSFDRLQQEVLKGMEGKNTGIPMGFDRLNNYIGIRKSISTLVGGLTGSGKTSFVDDAFVLNPFDYATSEIGKKANVKIKFWYRSMERNTTYKYAKWICRKIFIEQGVIIDVESLLSWRYKLSKDNHDLFLMYKDYLEELEDAVTMFDGPENPVGIAKDLQKYALTKGKMEQLDEYNKIYIPNDPNEINIVIIDHIGLLKTTKDLPTKKQAIDKLSNELRYARDMFGFSPVMISQFNRSISNPTRLKNNDVEPQLDDFKDSSSPCEDSDVVLALFDPARYKVDDPSRYNIDKLKDEKGSNCFRSVRLLKNSYGADDVRVGLGFFGQIGMFKELKKQKFMTDSDYENVTNKSWFLKK